MEKLINEYKIPLAILLASIVIAVSIYFTGNIKLSTKNEQETIATSSTTLKSVNADTLNIKDANILTTKDVDLKNIIENTTTTQGVDIKAIEIKFEESYNNADIMMWSVSTAKYWSENKINFCEETANLCRTGGLVKGGGLMYYKLLSELSSLNYMYGQYVNKSQTIYNWLNYPYNQLESIKNECASLGYIIIFSKNFDLKEFFNKLPEC